MDKRESMKRIRRRMLAFYKEPSVSTAEALAEACDYSEQAKLDFPVLPYLNCVSMMKPCEVLGSILTEAFYADNTKILDVFTHAPANNMGTIFTESVNKLIPHMMNAIVSHKHNKTLLYFMERSEILSDLMHSNMFEAAVCSGNYAIANCMQKKGQYNVSEEMLRTVIGKGNNKWLDLLTGNGDFIRQSNIIDNILYTAAIKGNTDILQWIQLLAQRYSPSFDGSREAEGEFIVRNSDIEDTVSNICACLSGNHIAEAEAVFDYLAERNIRMTDISIALSNCARILCDAGDAKDELMELMADSIARLADDSTYIVYENIDFSYMDYCGRGWNRNLKRLITLIADRLDRPLKLDVANQPSCLFADYNITLLRLLLKLCDVKPVKELVYDSVLRDSILEDRSGIIKSFLRKGLLSTGIISEMIDICAAYHRYDCLNEINKYCAKDRKKR